MRDEMLRERLIDAGVLRPGTTSLPQVQLPPGMRVLRMTEEDRARVEISYEYAPEVPCTNRF